MWEALEIAIGVGPTKGVKFGFGRNERNFCLSCFLRVGQYLRRVVSVTKILSLWLF